MNENIVDKKQSDAAILERAISFCNEAVFTVALQHRRLRSSEPEDNEFIFRWWADLQFLIVALRRLRRSAEIACQVSTISAIIDTAIHDFDQSLPSLTKLRNVGEHIEDYAQDRGHNKNVSHGQLRVGSWDGTLYCWLGETLSIDIALTASEKLFEAVIGSRSNFDHGH